MVLINHDISVEFLMLTFPRQGRSKQVLEEWIIII